ncbi:hypothetical protein ABVT39_016129, partial [Epinephelus coioides]
SCRKNSFARWVLIRNTLHALRTLSCACLAVGNKCTLERARRHQCAWAFAENISADLSQTSLRTVCYFTMALWTTNCFWAPNRFRTPAFSVFADTSPCQRQFQPQVVVSRCHLVAKSSHFALLILLRHLSK